MTVLSAQTIRRLGLVEPCLDAYRDSLGNSCGLSACGYDITLSPPSLTQFKPGVFLLLGATERFKLPAHVVGVVHDKSSWARRGLAVQNTVLEPGWQGYLTLEVTNHGPAKFCIPAGSAIAQVVFHYLDQPTSLPYRGKYQNQEPGPQEAR